MLGFCIQNDASDSLDTIPVYSMILLKMYTNSFPFNKVVRLMFIGQSTKTGCKT